MSIAFIFPGQGSQAVGMGQALAGSCPESRAVFDAADGALGESISGLCFEGPREQLDLTANTQPAILTASVAAWRAVQARGLTPDYVAGHSLGEYSALVAAGSLSIEQAVTTVRRRGQYMQEAVPVGVGAMAAVLALDLEPIEDACRRASSEGELVAAANINCPGQIVIAGHVAAVERAMALCKEAGARRAILLPVSAPFHCELMRPAQDRLAPDLAALEVRDPQVAVVNNVDARLVRRGSECRDALVRQVCGAVRWQQSIEVLLAEGVDTFVEIGPGKVLTGLVKKIASEARVLNVQVPADVDAAVASLGGGN